MNQKLNSVKVLFADSKYNYSTDVSANSTKESVNQYFVGKLFDRGIYPVEDMQQCVGVEFTDNNTTKQIPKQMTATQSRFFNKPRTMSEIMNGLFKGDAWAANQFQNDMLNSKQLILDHNHKFSKPKY